MDASFGINDDEIAESLEIFHLVLEILDEIATDNGIVAIPPYTTEIKIIDDDGMK